ncbi:peptidylprolyl isomerase [Flavobacterium alkalisoli]|uniref:Peptidylprolyl isomerase n=1 Tax=Flavobacterium alkalisoli TaxID=2602769 RepID=A0A5B9FMQ4_9FLAO|nr:peptidylprolyl isomerase [Flavobacterium alkalisoli]QEE48045.1 peptidylprolyl isomerase [Flavobacterium alkalisoli]
MKLKKVLLGVALCASSLSFSQKTQKEVLFTVNDNPYYTDEFIRVYKKNLDLVKDDSQKDLDNYLDLFIGYKLKVNKAYELGLQDNKKYQMELKNYRSQLSKNYLIDREVTDELVKEAYDRMQKEIKASHILFQIDENALPADTLKLYQKVMDVRKKALAGEDFAKLALKYSEDSSVTENKGELGYFSALRMVYPFETGAYNTPKGQISMPIRTRFGYHLIKVDDVRPYRGEVTVAHIMIAKPKDTLNTVEMAKVKTRVEEIYQKLKQGEDFAELAKQFSQDAYTNGKGGVLDKFSSGTLASVKFEDEAFSLKKAGDYTKPFETKFGWHIVKLIEKYPLKSFDEMKSDIEARVAKDDRSTVIAAAMTEKLKKQYPLVTDKAMYAKAKAAVNDDFYIVKWMLPQSADSYNATLLTINNDKKYTAWDFLEYVNSQQKSGITAKPVSRLVEILYDKFSSDKLKAYYDAHLEEEFPDFAAVMQEYRDGLLLFDLMEKEIWEKAKNDSIGLQNYYQAHIKDYQWGDRVDAEIYSSTDKSVVEQARKYLKKNKDAAYIKSELNTKDKVSVIEKSGVFPQDSKALPQMDKWKTGVSDIVNEGNYYYVLKVNKVLPVTAKTLDECKGRVVNDYQQYLESTWIDNLEKEFTVKVNQDVFAKVKKQLNQ